MRQIKKQTAVVLCSVLMLLVATLPPLGMTAQTAEGDTIPSPVTYDEFDTADTSTYNTTGVGNLAKFAQNTGYVVQGSGSLKLKVNDGNSGANLDITQETIGTFSNSFFVVSDPGDDITWQFVDGSGTVVGPQIDLVTNTSTSDLRFDLQGATGIKSTRDLNGNYFYRFEVRMDYESDEFRFIVLQDTDGSNTNGDATYSEVINLTHSFAGTGVAASDLSTLQIRHDPDAGGLFLDHMTANQGATGSWSGTVSTGSAKKYVNGTVKDADGNTIADSTVRGVVVNNSTIAAADPQQIQQEADQLLDEARSIEPPTQWRPDRALVGTDGLYQQTSAIYPAVHTPSDWQYQAFDGGRATLQDPAELQNPRLQVPEGTPALISLWDPGEEEAFEGQIEEDLPGGTTSGKAVLSRLGPDGSTVDSRTINTTAGVEWSGGLSLGSNTHRFAYLDGLQPGFYTVSPNASSVSVAFTVGDPSTIVRAYETDLRNEAGQLSNYSEQLEQRIQNNRIRIVKTTTASDGTYSLEVPSTAVSVDVVAYKGPITEINSILGTNTDPQNLTLAQVSRAYSQADSTLDSSFLPTDPVRVEPTANNTDLRVESVNVPPTTDLAKQLNLTERIRAAVENVTFERARQLFEERLGNLSSDRLNQRFERLRQLTDQNERLLDQYRTRLDELELNTNTSLDPRAVTDDELRERTQALSSTIKSLRSKIDATETTRDVGSDAVSLSKQFDADLSREGVTLLARYTNGTTRTFTPESDVVSISGNALGGDTVQVEDLPLGDAAGVSVEWIVANREGVGKSSEQVTNPSFEGDIPGLKAVSLSTLRPGPSETVDVELAPEDRAQFGSLTGLNVVGPDGGTIPTTKVDGVTRSFTTNGSGSYSVRATYTNGDGDEFQTTFATIAGEQDIEQPAQVRVTSSPGAGTYALVGNNLNGGDVAQESGGADTVVTVETESADALNRRVQVYLQGVDLPPDSTATIQFTDKQGRSLGQYVPVTVHMQDFDTDDALLYRNGEPVETESADALSINSSGTSTRITTRTDEAGAVEIATNSDPGLIERLQFAISTIDLDLPLTMTLIDVRGLGVLCLIGHTQRRRRGSAGGSQGGVA